VKEQPSGLIERLDLVFYWVADLARAVGFYREVFGWEADLKVSKDRGA